MDSSRQAFEKWYWDNLGTFSKANSTKESVFLRHTDCDRYAHPLTQSAYIGWQACAEEKDKRIAELEAECISFGIQINNASLKIDELTEQNKDLVEALDVLISRIKLFDNPSDCGISQDDDSVISAETLLAKVLNK